SSASCSRAPTGSASSARCGAGSRARAPSSPRAAARSPSSSTSPASATVAIDHDARVRAVEDNLAAMLRALARPDVFRAAVDDVAAAIAGAIRRAAGAPFLWWVGPSTRPPDLGARLLAAGFALHESLIGVTVDLETLAAPVLDGDVRVERVE